MSHEKKIRNTAILTAIILVLLGINYTFFRVGEVKYDVLVSLIGLYFFYRYHKNISQDKVTMYFFCSLLLLHNLYLYPYSIGKVPFDVFMHTYAGFVVAMIMDRWLRLENWGLLRRYVTIVLLVMGIGALHEMTEWLGQAVFGSGEGIFFFGAGDEGALLDTIQDLFFNLVGGIVFLFVTKR